MCDILIATPSVTKNKEMLFAKNSDRKPNEAQVIEYLPRQQHQEERVDLTYVSVPQATETYAVLLSRPWWMWGAEMGTNEFGLTIGNTAVFTTEKYQSTGMLGMDILRLALERTKNAKQALQFIAHLIEAGFQGGDATYEQEFFSPSSFYHNSFVIADPHDAWVVETAGRHWVAKQVETFYTISNTLTISHDWDLASDGVKKLATHTSNFSFAKHFSGLFAPFAHGRERANYTRTWLQERKGTITVKSLMKCLRSHQRTPFKPSRGSMKDVCMHYGGITRPLHTAASQISQLTENIQLHWLTGTSNPCLSFFKPVFLGKALPKLEDSPTNTYSPQSYWWRNELFHRIFQTNYECYIQKFSMEQESLQEYIRKTVLHARNNYLEGKIDKNDLFELTKWAFRKEKQVLEKWMRRIKPGAAPFLYGMNWRKINERADLPRLTA